MTEDARRLEADVRMALVTGAVGWRDRNSSYTPAELVATSVLGTSVVAVSTVLLVSAGLPANGAALTGGSRWLAAGVGTATLIVGVAPTLTWPLGWRPRRATPPRALAVIRVGAAMVVVGCWTALLGLVAPVPVWPLGAVVGCEVTLTAWALGLQAGGRDWWWRFQRSSVHAGILLAGFVVVALEPDRAGQVLRVLVTFQVIALAAALTCHALSRLRRAFEDRDATTGDATTTAAHGRLAHWLHDEVTSPLRLLRFRLETAQLTAAGGAEELAKLDHQLRLRQLEEVLERGSAQLAEVLQPYVRLAQDHGVEVVEVPRFDEAAVAVEGRAGRLVQRALGVLVPNAIAAGADRVAFRVGTHAGDVVIEVEDDAGGFDLAKVPAGRGLDGLQRELGPGGVTCVPVPGGSRVRVVIGTDGRS